MGCEEDGKMDNDQLVERIDHDDRERLDDQDLGDKSLSDEERLRTNENGGTRQMHAQGAASERAGAGEAEGDRRKV